MKANHSIKYHSLVLFLAMLSLPLNSIALTSPAQGTSTNQSAQDDKIVMPLGKIKVRGEPTIIRALQDIKVAYISRIPMTRHWQMWWSAD
ncbi:MAG: hypothetical protein ACRETA_06000 [Gammaproteobacteria bacterium]